MSTHFDYSQLSIPVTFSERVAYMKQRSAANQAVFWTMTILIGASLFWIIGFAILTSSGGDRMTSVTMIPIILVWLVFVGIIAVMLWVSSARAIMMKRFADSNNMSYYEGTPREQRNGMIFNQGDNRKFAGLLTLSTQHVTEIGNYSFTTGSGKSQVTHTYGYIRMKLPRRLPNIILDSRSNNLLGGLVNPLSYFGNSQKLQLEGDFNNYFDLYVPDGYEKDALYIFTPDVMQTMIAAAHKYDCEIIDDDLYIYSLRSIQLQKSESIEELMNVVDSIYPELANQTDYYADERVANRSSNVIAPEGRQLKKPTQWVIIIVAGIFFVMWAIIQIFMVKL